MFEKSLSDLVKGIRANKNNEDSFIRSCLAEIKNELRSNDGKKKAEAVRKLSYLHMMGYDMQWAAFHVIEVIAQPQFHLKRVGYLAASQCFNEKTEVIMLITQLLRKELTSGGFYETGLAISCLASIATPDLAKDLSADIVALLNSSRPYIRKKAVLALFKIFVKYPEALRVTFPRIKEKLADPHPSVVSASVNVICELARKNPSNYLGMAPVFYKLLTTLNNNWTLIKIVKLLGELAPLEPRLGKKLVEPLANIINTTGAKSLLYECLCTVTKGLNKHVSVVKLAVEKLKMFIEDPDQNLKYLGLLGLNNLMTEYPKIIAELKDTILNCLEDEDVTIRQRAIDLLCGVVNKKNSKNIIQRLMKQLKTAEGQYKNFLVEKIIDTCSKDNYEAVGNFKWYLEKLIDLTAEKGVEHGHLIANQIMDVVIRVKAVRAFGISECVKLLTSSHFQRESSATSNMFEVLYAAAYVVGEFFLEAEEEDPKKVLESLLKYNGIVSLPTRIQVTYLQSALKVYAHLVKPPTLAALSEFEGEAAVQPNYDVTQDQAKLNKFAEYRSVIREGIEQNYISNADVEVQERSQLVLKLVTMHEELLSTGVDIGGELASLFDEELNPVAPGAQKKVKVPEGLNLDEWIGEPFEANLDKIGDDTSNRREEEEEEEENQETGVSGKAYRSQKSEWYLDDKKKKKNDPNIEVKNASELLGEKPKKKKVKAGTKKTTKKKIADDEQHSVSIKGFEMPEGADVKEKDVDDEDDGDLLKKVDLTKPIGEGEGLYVPKAYPKASESKPTAPAEPEKKSTPKKKEEKAKEETKEKASESKSKKAPKKEEKKKGPRKRLCKDANMSVAFATNALPTDSNRISIPLVFENTNTSNLSITGITFNVNNSTSGFKLMASSSSKDQADKVTINANIAPKAFDVSPVTLRFETANTPLHLIGNIEYTLSDSTSKKIKFDMALPVSIFMQPKAITAEQFIQIMKSGKLTASGSASVSLPALKDKINSVDDGAHEIASLLRLEIIDHVKGTAYQMYGISAQGHHIAALIKSAPNAPQFTVQMKSSDSELVNNLATEVNKHFAIKSE